MNRRHIGKHLLRPGDEYGPGGRRICRYVNCRNEVPKGRRTWCSDGCVHEYRLQADWKYARQHLRKREKGVCQTCGANAVKLKGTLMKPWKLAVGVARANRLHKNLYSLAEYQQLSLEYSAAAQALTAQGFHGFPPELPQSWRPRKLWKEPRDLWEADHIQAVVHGGTHAPANLRTLCQPCHKKATLELAQRRRQSRIAEGGKPGAEARKSDDEGGLSAPAASRKRPGSTATKSAGVECRTTSAGATPLRKAPSPRPKSATATAARPGSKNPSPPRKPARG